MPTNRLLVKEETAVYANTLLQAAQEDGGVERVVALRDQLGQVLYAFREDSKIREALSNPALSAQQRYELTATVFQELDPLAVSTLAIMAERGSLDRLSAVLQMFLDGAEEKLGVSIVDVTTVVELDDELRKVIKDKVSADLGHDVVLCEHIDKSILGGIIMTTNGKHIDASVLFQLEKARAALKETADGGEC